MNAELSAPCPALPLALDDFYLAIQKISPNHCKSRHIDLKLIALRKAV